MAIIEDYGFWNSMARENGYKVVDHFLGCRFSKYSDLTISLEVVYNKDEFVSFPFE